MSYECPKCNSEATIMESDATGCIFCGAPFATKCPNCLRMKFIELEGVCYGCDYDAVQDPNHQNWEYGDPDPVQQYSTEDETWVDVD